eukprot:TRINITY_DN4383_c0_g1_i1.p1 TRINITY_DN4383_c0_g1~~TRINITY_DN4383_c0_g1_i1.p1  ORF type:complete len:326 (+),score=88.69 TRINITY_DN4383_c0_g1_i1:30-1007(+)
MSETEKLAALLKVNDEIKERIKSNMATKFTLNTYNILLEPNHRYSLEESQFVSTGEGIVSSHKFKLTFEVLPDIFKITPVYDVKNYDQLVKLEADLKEILNFAELFVGKSVLNNIAIMSKFKKNFELIQVGLGQIEEKMKPPTSKKNLYQESLNQINQKLLLLGENNDISFGIRETFWSVEKSSKSLTFENLKVTKSGSCSYSMAIAHQGWSHGVHKWRLKSTGTRCYDTIGVVTNKQGCDEPMGTHSWGLGVDPGDHRRRDGPNVKFPPSKIEPGIYECTLDFNNQTFEVQYSTGKTTIPLNGTKEPLFPAVVLCHGNVSYEFI